MLQEKMTCFLSPLFLRNSNFPPFHQNGKLFQNTLPLNLNFLKNWQVAPMPFFQSRNLKSFMISNFFCQIISETSLIFVYHHIKRGTFLKKFQKPKRGEVNVEQAMIFDEVLQVVENTTSNFSERADAKYSERGNSIAFNFILRRIFGNCTTIPTSTFLILKSYFSETHSCAVCERAFFTSKELERHQYKKRHWG